jgi:Skp family chaperone for outer membrane proteins
MRINNFLCIGVALVLILTTGAAAQTVAVKGKVAVINTYIFGDEERGIKKLAVALRSLYGEDPGAAALEEQRTAAQKEIDARIAQNKPINEAYLKLNALNSEYNRRLGNRKTEIDKKHRLFVEPVYEEIRGKLKEFTALKGYSVVIDIGDSGFLVEGEIDDITQEFIQFCNDAFEKEKNVIK